MGGGDPLNAIEIIHKVEAHGGSLRVEGTELHLAAPAPLPDELMAEVTASKPAIMIALGVPLDATVASILADLRPHLAPALKKLPDDRLLALVNWHIIHAWNESLRRAGGELHLSSQKRPA